MEKEKAREIEIEIEIERERERETQSPITRMVACMVGCLETCWANRATCGKEQRKTHTKLMIKLGRRSIEMFTPSWRVVGR